MRRALVYGSETEEEKVSSLNPRPAISSVGDSWMVRGVSEVDVEKMDWLR
jgi:hypothetical protein